MDLLVIAKKSYFEYEITTDGNNCETPLKENAYLKIIAENTDTDKSYCLLVWTCRKSRAGVHAICTKNKVSKKQQTWIDDQFAQLKLHNINLINNADLKNGKCFKKK